MYWLKGDWLSTNHRACNSLLHSPPFKVRSTTVRDDGEMTVVDKARQGTGEPSGSFEKTMTDLRFSEEERRRNAQAYARERRPQYVRNT